MNYPYYNGYIPQYQPQNLQPAQMSPANQLLNQQSPDNRIWVQNETAAEAYLVAANSFVRLWDSSRPVFYEKQADATGRPLPLVAYKYEKIANEPVLDTNGTSVYEQKFNALERRILALEGIMAKEDNHAELITESDEANAGLESL